MTEAYLLGRLRLRFCRDEMIFHGPSLGNLSAMAWQQTAHNAVLWVGGDEALQVGASVKKAALAPKRNAISVLHRDEAGLWGLAEVVALRELLPQARLQENEKGDEDEVDLEGFDLHRGYLWFTGSHASARKKPKPGKGGERRLRSIDADLNRFLIGRIPVEDGRLLAATGGRTAAVLPPAMGADGLPGNSLTRALAADPHLAPFLKPLPAEGGPARLPGKDNGFDIEGIARTDSRLYLGLRGPVLRGWALILELNPQDDGGGLLRLGEVGDDGSVVAKHFVDLKGMGVRDLTFDGDDLLILAGPTMDLDGTQALWRLRSFCQLANNSLTGGSFDADQLCHLFDLPVTGDRAEALCRFDHQGERAVLIAYDATATARYLPAFDGAPIHEEVYADLFRLPPA